MRVFVFAEKFFLKNEVKNFGYLEITKGVFGNYYEEIPVKNAKIIHHENQWIAPGLVDTHIHGYKNYEVMDNEIEGLKKMSDHLLACGVTSFLPTTLTANSIKTKEVVQTIGMIAPQVEGAKIQGIYMEGPFFTEKYKGAQNANYFRDPNIELFNEWQEASGGLIKKIALAPECEGAEAFIASMVDQDVVVALGHSDANLGQAIAAMNAGASIFVHAFNAMSSLNHREPGMVGALLSSKAIFAELICDGHHVHPIVAKLLVSAIGHEHVALITDCMKAGGMAEGIYTLGELPVTVKEGVARLDSGNLAGSILQLNEAIKNIVDWGIATPEQAIQMATLIPAVSCKIEDKCGVIEQGREADFTVFNPDMTLVATYLNGEERYHRYN